MHQTDSTPTRDEHAENNVSDEMEIALYIRKLRKFPTKPQKIKNKMKKPGVQHTHRII